MTFFPPLNRSCQDKTTWRGNKIQIFLSDTVFGCSRRRLWVSLPRSNNPSGETDPQHSHYDGHLRTGGLPTQRIATPGRHTVRREDQKMTVDHGVAEPAWWTAENGFGSVWLCLSGSLAVGIKVIATTLLGLFSNVNKAWAASKKGPLEALLPQNCHFLYQVHGTQSHFVYLWQSIVFFPRIPSQSPKQSHP